MKCISLNYVLLSDRTLDIFEIGPLYNSQTQLNVCEKEELPCFLYLIQIFGVSTILGSNHKLRWKSDYDRNITQYVPGKQVLWKIIIKGPTKTNGKEQRAKLLIKEGQRNLWLSPKEFCWPFLVCFACCVFSLQCLEMRFISFPSGQSNTAVIIVLSTGRKNGKFHLCAVFGNVRPQAFLICSSSTHYYWDSRELWFKTFNMVVR